MTTGVSDGYHRRAVMKTERKGVRDYRYMNGPRITTRVDETSQQAAWYGAGAADLMELGVKRGGVSQPIAGRGNAGSAPLISARGLRKDIGGLIVLMLVLFLFGSFCVNLTKLHATEKDVDGVRQNITVAERNNRQYETDLLNAQRSVNVGYEAAQLGMISSASVEAIRLTVPEVDKTDRIVQQLNAGNLANLSGD